MTMVQHIAADRAYRIAEKQAAQYLASLTESVRTGGYRQALTEDFRDWQPKHIRSLTWGSRFVQGVGGDTDERYIRWLHRSGRLDAYLERSVTYLYMRDLGQAPDEPATKTAIARMTARLKDKLLQAPAGAGLALMGVSGFYRWAQSEGVESAAIWVIGKLRRVAANLPDEMEAQHAQRKLMKIILGVVLHAIEGMEEGAPPEERSRRIAEAIRLGYAYGLTYPFIDDLLDSKALTTEEKARYTEAIRTTLVTGQVPEDIDWGGQERPLLTYVYTELSEAFAFIKAHQQPGATAQFFEQAYVFFHAQELDRLKLLTDASYSETELYLPIILKSASSRLIARAVLSAPDDDGFQRRTFYYGLYNQLADDFADLADDLREGAVTPYTYYLTHRVERPDLMNPFELYWAVIHYLIHEVYGGNDQAREVILNRAIGGLKRCKARIGEQSYSELMTALTPPEPAFHRMIQRMVERADEVDFFDKLLRDRLASHLQEERTIRAAFEKNARRARERINAALSLDQGAAVQAIQPLEEPLTEAANYILASGGKRLRPVLSWMLGVEVFGLPEAALMPMLRSLEYMHTASLVFDDLPSQDDAELRRGRPTLHRVHDSATAELTGLLLIQRAVQEQASLTSFAPQAVLALIRYSAEKAEDLCRGQAMDLQAKGKVLSLEQLESLCFYKTGIGFEASLIMPALLAEAGAAELDALKRFAYYAGIAFQIKDDLLDGEGDDQLVGKPVRQDERRGRPTFVTMLGEEEARRQMWERYCLAVETLRELPRGGDVLAQALDYMVHRER
ncbi:polyprenyl synthetase family protein [Paenibacillus daejeonensis]|uniref:polyprenyl synthetase family protein n=1 Tax=Paenibacillus daejeonensis TaxID=135193 RepID=UPI00036C0763|nr:polyprenyl synthetase family protein [Paenibacillus daejeonensis]